MTDLPHLTLYRRGTGTALVLAPAFFLADNLLHPEELARGNEAEQLAAIGEAYTRWQLAHVLGLATIVLFAAAILGLAFLVRRRQPGLGLLGGALGIAGLLGLASVLAIDGYTWGVLGDVATREGVDRATVEETLAAVQESDWSLPYYLLPLAWIVGVVVLAIGAARQGAVPLPAAGLLVVGALMVGTETAIVSNAYFVAGAAVLLLGGIAVGASVARMADADFARGGGAGA